MDEMSRIAATAHFLRLQRPGVEDCQKIVAGSDVSPLAEPTVA